MATQGVLLLNLGTPDSTEVSAVRRYLREFLLDPRVIDLPAVARWLLVNLTILPFRSKQSAAAYQKIWTEQGSPLLYHGQQLTQAVADQLSDDYHVVLAMRYGNPSIAEGLQCLLQQGISRLIVLPLFPQYSSAATGSAIEKTLSCLQSVWNIPEVKIVSDFFQDPGFIQALQAVVAPHLQEFSPDLVLFSYHGLPERHIAKSGCATVTTACSKGANCPTINQHNRFCYRAQCYATSKALAQALGLADNQYRVAFQSRLGRIPWIKPYTDLLLPELYQQGVRRLAVACPSFVADCLETVEEIGIRAREQWKQLGGEALTLIPCVNAHEQWVTAVKDMIEQR